jgi:hypothetical protein
VECVRGLRFGGREGWLGSASPWRLWLLRLYGGTVDTALGGVLEGFSGGWEATCWEAMWNV